MLHHSPHKEWVECRPAAWGSVASHSVSPDTVPRSVTPCDECARPPPPYNHSNSKSNCRFVQCLIMKSVKYSGWYVFNRITQFYLLPKHLSTCQMNHPAFTHQPQNITALWTVLLTSHPGEGRRLSWPGWLGKDTRVVYPPMTVTHAITNRAQRTVTLLMQPMMLPLHHATTTTRQCTVLDN